MGNEKGAEEIKRQRKPENPFEVFVTKRRFLCLSSMFGI